MKIRGYLIGEASGGHAKGYVENGGRRGVLAVSLLHRLTYYGCPNTVNRLQRGRLYLVDPAFVSNPEALVTRASHERR